MERRPKAPAIDGEQAIEIVARIRQNMTFDEVSKVVSLSTNIHAFDGEHGGVWYVVSIGGGYSVQLRFEHPYGKKNPEGKKNIRECLLNLPPVLQEAK
jgi:hypothetical protein